MLVRFRSTILGVLLGIGLVGGPDSFAMGGSPSPSTAPADTASNLKTALLQLSDRDPTVRDSAREQLMAMPPTDLPALRAAVEQIRPLPPGDAQALHDIVTHVYLAGENADGDGAQGFMGISMTSELQSVYSDDEDDADSELPLGVVVQMRLPGFDAYRALRDGDIILTVGTDSTGALRVHAPQRIIEIVSTLAPGQRVRLEVIRNGQRIQRTVTLNPHPRGLGGNLAATPEDFRSAREAKAGAFWDARFAAVVDRSIS